MSTRGSQEQSGPSTLTRWLSMTVIPPVPRVRFRYILLGLIVGSAAAIQRNIFPQASSIAKTQDAGFGYSLFPPVSPQPVLDNDPLKVEIDEAGVVMPRPDRSRVEESSVSLSASDAAHYRHIMAITGAANLPQVMEIAPTPRDYVTLSVQTRYFYLTMLNHAMNMQDLTLQDFAYQVLKETSIAPYSSTIIASGVRKRILEQLNAIRELELADKIKFPRDRIALSRVYNSIGESLKGYPEDALELFKKAMSMLIFSPDSNTPPQALQALHSTQLEYYITEMIKLSGEKAKPLNQHPHLQLLRESLSAESRQRQGQGQMTVPANLPESDISYLRNTKNKRSIITIEKLVSIALPEDRKLLRLAMDNLASIMNAIDSEHFAREVKRHKQVREIISQRLQFDHFKILVAEAYCLAGVTLADSNRFEDALEFFKSAFLMLKNNVLQDADKMRHLRYNLNHIIQLHSDLGQLSARLDDIGKTPHADKFSDINLADNLRDVPDSGDLTLEMSSRLHKLLNTLEARLDRLQADDIDSGSLKEIIISIRLRINMIELVFDRRENIEPDFEYLRLLTSYSRHSLSVTKDRERLTIELLTEELKRKIYEILKMLLPQAPEPIIAYFEYRLNELNKPEEEQDTSSLNRQKQHLQARWRNYFLTTENVLFTSSDTNPDGDSSDNRQHPILQRGL